MNIKHCLAATLVPILLSAMAAQAAAGPRHYNMLQRAACLYQGYNWFGGS